MYLLILTQEINSYQFIVLCTLQVLVINQKITFTHFLLVILPLYQRTDINNNNNNFYT